MAGVYSIAEVVDDSNKKPDRTVYCFLESDGEQSFTTGQVKSLVSVANMVMLNGGKVCGSLEEVANYLNNY